MSDDRLPERDDFMRAALRAARADVPSSARIDGIARAVRVAVAPPTPPQPARPTPSHTPWGAGPLKLVGVGAVVVAIGAAALAPRPAPVGLVPAMTSPVAVSSTTPSAVVSSPMPVATFETPAVDVNALPPAPRAQGSSRPVAMRDSAGEMTLLRAARASLARDPADALATCEEHARQYAHGALAEEREVLAIDALLRLSRHSEAVARATKFRATYPDSAYGPRLETLFARP
ncbi:hypothetical protein AKJ09_10595 [Labilithrix luteola]|uniref:Uncharacterized protein n=1 Tax=Labilithrix luteola TaxID=1391654 RepID=A0A0K1QE43_9BACT|nr:hypothetical protein [Labilithrix luteola]AKV03932.1 hypothetical protein AKJ09_10595 [Labilithrix luteola]